MNLERYKRLRDLREDHDMTQKAVGEAINVPQRTYAYYESGQRMIPPRVLCALADLYGVTMDRDTLRAEAVKFEMHHPGRTPRTARQFIASLSL